MTPPYKTKSGLQIGSLYTPSTTPHHDGDALRLQQALLGCGGMTATEEGIAIVCIALIAALLAVALVTGVL